MVLGKTASARLWPLLLMLDFDVHRVDGQKGRWLQRGEDQKQSGTHKHKLEAQEDELQHMAFLVASDLGGTEGLQNVGPSTLELNASI